MTVVKICEKEGGYSITVRGDLFSDVIDALKEIVPSYYRSFSTETKTWTISSRHYLREWLNEVRRWAVQVEWTAPGQEYRREYQRPRQTWRDQRAEAFKALHLRESAPVELIAAAKKVLNSKYHPDRPDGDLRLCQEVNAAADLLMREAA